MKLHVNDTNEYLVIDECTSMEYSQLQISYNKEVKNARFSPAYKNAQWDGKINFIQGKYLPAQSYKYLFDMCKDFGFDCEIDEFSFRQFQAAINDEELNLEGNKIYRDGAAEGIIWGGNLATLVSLCGTDFIPNEDFIFFAEDLNEAVYKIDKMFTQLFNIKEFKKHCKGIVLGDFLDCGNEKWLEEFFFELSEIHKIPIIGGFKITHNRKKITIPIGKDSILSGANLKIEK